MTAHDDIFIASSIGGIDHVQLKRFGFGGSLRESRLPWRITTAPPCQDPYTPSKGEKDSVTRVAPLYRTKENGFYVRPPRTVRPRSGRRPRHRGERIPSSTFDPRPRLPGHPLPIPGVATFTPRPQPPCPRNLTDKISSASRSSTKIADRAGVPTSFCQAGSPRRNVNLSAPPSG
jgi:hypothetical protein